MASITTSRTMLWKTHQQEEQSILQGILMASKPKFLYWIISYNLNLSNLSSYQLIQHLHFNWEWENWLLMVKFITFQFISRSLLIGFSILLLQIWFWAPTSYVRHIFGYYNQRFITWCNCRIIHIRTLTWLTNAIAKLYTLELGSLSAIKLLCS